jgi:hypothetical protein
LALPAAAAPVLLAAVPRAPAAPAAGWAAGVAGVL